MRHSSDGTAIDLVALAILRRDDHIVMVQQRAAHDDRVYWVLPGGLVEPGELAVDALVREVREEAGVQVAEVGQLACCSQIDRPAHPAQTVVFVFEVAAWHGTLAHHQDPDEEILAVELVPADEAIERLAHNGGWPGFRGPLLAYLRGGAGAGTLWCYREGEHGQEVVAVIPEEHTPPCR